MVKNVKVVTLDSHGNNNKTGKQQVKKRHTHLV